MKIKRFFILFISIVITISTFTGCGRGYSTTSKKTLEKEYKPITNTSTNTKTYQPDNSNTYSTKQKENRPIINKKTYKKNSTNSYSTKKYKSNSLKKSTATRKTRK